MDDKKLIYIDTECQPYMYNSDNDLTQYVIGSVVNVTFQDKRTRIKKEYKGKTVKFIVNNTRPYINQHETCRRLALVPFDNQEDYKMDEVVIVDDTQRFRNKMMLRDKLLRRPFAGWKNKTVTITKVVEPKIIKTK